MGERYWINYADSRDVMTRLYFELYGWNVKCSRRFR